MIDYIKLLEPEIKDQCHYCKNYFTEIWVVNNLVKDGNSKFKSVNRIYCCDNCYELKPWVKDKS